MQTCTTLGKTWDEWVSSNPITAALRQTNCYWKPIWEIPGMLNRISFILEQMMACPKVYSEVLASPQKYAY